MRNPLQFCVVLSILLAIGANPPAEAQNLVFSEIMFNPAPGTNIYASDDYEFIELHNAGAGPVDLTKAYFSKGITYTFSNVTMLAAGQYLVIAKNTNAFTERYPSVTNRAPWFFDGQLANDGEEITLKNTNGITLFSATYSDRIDLADGNGSSLVFAHPAADPDEPTNWCASARLHGNPGGADTCAEQTLVINEILAHTDWPLQDSVEIFNPGTNAINPSGWYLSDDNAIRNKYRISITNIPAGGYLVISNTQFAAADIPFALSELGESVYLTSADSSSNLAGTVDFHEFEASENGWSFGRYPNGTGTMVTMAALSLGTSNGPPRVGPAVISEIMYNPANDTAEDEYLELLNISGAPLELYDPANPSNTWKLTTAVEFTFPSGLVLAANERLLIVGTTNIPLFVQTHALATNVQIIGAWTGRLNNAGEEVRLYKPGPPETNMVPYYLVENIDYSDDDPWPTAPDGNGPSLERIHSTNYGNTAENWFAGAPGGSPGAAPVAGLINGTVSPPAAGIAFTATVSVVAETMPTQVLFSAEIAGIASNWVMRDDGTAGDLVSGDQIYTAVIPGQADDQWIYYQFHAFSTNDAVISAPASETEYVESPGLTLQIAWQGLRTVVEPGPAWTTYEASGWTSHEVIFDIFLNGAGEVLVDDIVLLDAGLTNHVPNGEGDFEAPLAGWRFKGNHSNSYREVLSAENSNGVLHVVSTGAGASYNDAVGFNMDPPMVSNINNLVHLTFRARQVGREVPQWSWVAVGTPPLEPVINEIMYHSAATNEDDFEYIEIFNPGPDIDLSGARLSGAGFTFENGTLLASNAFLAACKSPSLIAAEYGITNVTGPLGGTLQNSGEEIRLENSYGRVMDGVEYGEKRPWPEAADGYGPSLERRSRLLPSSNAASWAASSVSTNWQTVTWTTEIASANSGLKFFLDFDGKVWLDNVSVKPAAGGGEMLPNGSFESGMTGWSATGNHWRSRTEASAGITGSTALAVAGTFSRFVFPGMSPDLVVNHGDAATNCVSSGPLPATNGHSYVVSMQVRRSGVGGTLHIAAGGAANSVSLGLRGTPGAANSAQQDLPAPLIEDVDKLHDIVDLSQTNVITAEIPSGGIATVTLNYRIFTTNGYQFTDHLYSSLPMTNAGAGIYRVEFPPVTTRWSVVRYHVVATGTNGMVSRIPREDDPQCDYAFWANGHSPQTTLPDWHLFIDGNPVIYPVAARGCAVSPDGQVFLDTEIRHRGGPTTNYSQRGLAMRTHRARPLDTWFADNQGGINFRHRQNNSAFYHRRIVNEPIAYDIQRAIGLPAPRLRHIVMWIDGAPTITTELEDPEESYAEDNGIPLDDLLTRSGNAGRRIIVGDESLDNLWSVVNALDAAAPGDIPALVETHLDYESIRYVLGFFGAIGNIDQNISWNMFQHRSASDGKWRQYPWDTDFGLALDTTFNPAPTNMHPYYATPLHFSDITDNTNGAQFARALFYPESGSGAEHTLPYRHRQQMTLWRYYHTFLTTNYLTPRLDAMQAQLLPAYVQLESDYGIQPSYLSNAVKSVKTFIASRRNYLMNSSWSDKDTNIWAGLPAYDPGTVVINEIMPDPSSGGEYLELYNRASYPVDLSWWKLQIGDEEYRLPHGSTIGPTSYAVVADTQSWLTNAYQEISDPALMILRHAGGKVWDWPIVWTSAVEHSTRIIEVSSLTLPNSGADISLTDVCSNLIDSLTYTNAAPWPYTAGISMELLDAVSDNSQATSWRASFVVGTPGYQNSSSADADEDGMNDEFEQLIIAASGGAFSNIYDVGGSDDFDDDGLPNYHEYVMGTDPLTDDSSDWLLEIAATNSEMQISMQTLAATGTAYELYSRREYTFEQALSPTGSWSGIFGWQGLTGDGQRLVLTNSPPEDRGFYRGYIQLVPLRQP